MEWMQKLGYESYYPGNMKCLFKYKNKNAVKDYEKSKSWQINKCLMPLSDADSKDAESKSKVEDADPKEEDAESKSSKVRKRKQKLKSKEERKIERRLREERKLVPRGLDPENVKELGVLIVQGKKVNVESLFSTVKYLVDCNGNRVTVSSLLEQGKHILIQHCQLPLSLRAHEGIVFWALKRALPDKRCSDVQLVIVATIDHPSPCPNADAEALFESTLAAFPSDKCLAIPISDSASSLRVSGFLHSLAVSGSLLLDPNGVVLHVSYLLMMELGADYFPFSLPRIEAYMDSIQSLLTQRPVPLENLLGVGLDHRLSNAAGTRTTLVSDLKPKLVGLYLCQTGQHMDIVLQASKRCRANNLELQVVLVYLPLTDYPGHLITCANAALSEKANKQQQQDWWLLPFNDSTSRRLWNLCNLPASDEFIIVGPYGQFMDPRALNLIASPYVSASASASALRNMYPFAVELIARQETDRLRQLTFESLLSSNPYNHLTSSDGHSGLDLQLQGKIVCLFILNCDDKSYDDPFEIMASWCRARQCQGAAHKYSKFVLVFVPFYHSSNLNFESDPRMSWLRDPAMGWLICRPTHACQDSIIKHATLRGVPFGLNPLNCIVFGEDGKLVSMGLPQLSQIQAEGFPPDQLYEELLDQYSTQFGYDDHDRY